MDAAGLESKNSVIAAQLDIFAYDEIGAALTYDNGTGLGPFTIAEFNPEKFRLRIAQVFSRATSFSMSHIASIKNYWEKIKPALVVVNFFLIAILSFGLGRLTKIEEVKEPIKIETATVQTTTTAIHQVNSINPASSAGKFVGSKNGTKYHYPWCSGATRIKEENKIWFQTAEEAKRTGYSPAANCPGLR